MPNPIASNPAVKQFVERIMQTFQGVPEQSANKLAKFASSPEVTKQELNAATSTFLDVSEDVPGAIGTVEALRKEMFNLDPPIRTKPASKQTDIVESVKEVTRTKDAKTEEDDDLLNAVRRFISGE